MSFYLSHIDATEQHRWQRYNIALDEKALADACACLEAEATNLWSFRLLQGSVSSVLDPVYVFFFHEMSDLIVLRKFDASRRGR
jgi:hypothetical protein